MKLFIKLKENQENKNFIENMKDFDFGKIEKHLDDKNLEIVLSGNFYVESSKRNDLWICDKDYVYACISLNNIQRFVIKDIRGEELK